jgi:UDP-N-acetylmuramate dehydrogenase
MIEVQPNVPLSSLTWWKVGGTADHFVSPRTLMEVEEALAIAAQNGWPLTILGGGSNVLISDRGVSGLTICLKDLVGVEKSDVNPITQRLEIVTLAGTKKSELTKIFMNQKLAPALFLCGIPGEVGGGVVMNAGVGESITPREFCEIVDWVEVMSASSGKVLTSRISRDQLTWTYRSSVGWQPGIITRVGLSWPMESHSDLVNQVREMTLRRRQKQPLEWPSCGSVFRNPDGGKAGAMIEKAGLKGFRVGGAEVSEKHANFIINRGGATAHDVMNVITHVQATIAGQFGVELHAEVKFIGRWD